MPVRIIEGQATRIARVIHQFGFDPVHDEIVIPNAFAAALLFFRTEANGEEAPIRVIQGPKTKLGYTDNVAVDPIHNEVFVPQFFKNAVLVFRRDVGDDVAPIRIIHGPKTKLNQPWGVAVDPKNDLLVISSGRDDPKGILIFKRTANGDVTPQAFISGPKAGLKPGLREGRALMVVLYPEGKKIFAAMTGAWDRKGPSPGFIGVWKYTDNGDVAPWAAIKGPATKINTPYGVALNPEAKEIMVIDGEDHALFVYHIPELFESEAATKQ